MSCFGVSQRLEECLLPWLITPPCGFRPTVYWCSGVAEGPGQGSRACPVHSSEAHHTCCGSALAPGLLSLSSCLVWKLLQQEITLEHEKPPESLAAAEAGIRKFEDFLLSMENNKDKVLSPVDSGNKLVDEGNLYSDKIKEKVQQIEDRYSWP